MNIFCFPRMVMFHQQPVHWMPCMLWCRGMISYWHQIKILEFFQKLHFSELNSQYRWFTEGIFPVHLKKAANQVNAEKAICRIPALHLCHRYFSNLVIQMNLFDLGKIPEHQVQKQLGKVRQIPVLMPDERQMLDQRLVLIEQRENIDIRRDQAALIHQIHLRDKAGGQTLETDGGADLGVGAG